jgi:hypothetical protein
MTSTKKKSSKLAAAIMGKTLPGYAEGGEVGDGHDAAISEFMDAVHRKDHAGVKSALKSYVSMCIDESSEADPDHNKDQATGKFGGREGIE